MKKQFIHVWQKAIVMLIAVAMITGSTAITIYADDAINDLANLLEIAEAARDAVEDILEDIETIIDESSLDQFAGGTVDQDNIGEVADLVTDAYNVTQAANQTNEYAQKAIDAAEAAIEIAKEAFEAAEEAIEAAEEAIELAEEAVEAANKAIQAAIDAEADFLKALDALDDIDAIRKAEAEMNARREAAIAAQKAAEEAIANQKAASSEAWDLLSDALSTAIAAYEEAINSFEAAVTQADIEEAARQRIEANQAVADALAAQLNALTMVAAANAAIEHSYSVNEMAQAIIDTALETVGLAGDAVDAANDMTKAVNEIVEAVEGFIIYLISKQDGIHDVTDNPNAGFVDYIAFYYNFLREMAYRIFDYEIGPAKTIADFENMTVQEFNDIINKMNAAVSMILAHNAEAYAEYQLILQALEAAFRRAADGTPEGAFPDPIFTDNPITSTTGGSHLFTPEFHPFFVNLLIARWNKYLMHQHLSADEMLQKAIGIANRGVLRRPDDSPWQMVSVVGGSNPTFKPNSDGTFTFTTTWDVRADQQQQGHQYQQIIAIDWNRPASQGGGVVSFVWFLEGKYAPGQQINLIFTEDMMRSISGHNFNANGGSGGTIVIKRIAYQENLDEMVLYQLQSLPTTFANIPTASLVLEHSLNDVYLDFPEFGFAGFETEFDDFPDPIPDDEEPAVPEDDDSSTSGGGSGNRITRFSSPPTSPPSIPGEDPPTAPDAPDDPPTIPDAPVSPPADLPPPEAPPTVPDDPGAPPTDPSPPDMPQTGINNSLKLFGIGLLVSLLASIMLGISIAKRQHLK